MNPDQLKRIYFLGIGGIGMSALARYFHRRGVEVYGYDRTPSELTGELEKEGMEVNYTEDPSLVPTEIDLAVVTPAVPVSHPAFRVFADRGIPVMKRAEVLGLISRSSRCVAIAGTHGKTTTSTIVAHLFREAGSDCSAFLGGISGNYGTNYLLGKDDWMVVEADEYDRSFLYLSPSILVINALDPDHLDIYRDEEDMRQTYFTLMRQVGRGGYILLKDDLDVPESVLGSLEATVLRFGRLQADYQLSNVRQSGETVRFDLTMPDGSMHDLVFPLPGMHNAHNAAAAFICGTLAGLSPERLKEGLRSFRGVRRRFDIHLDLPGMAYVDDYAHHPAELMALAQAVRDRFPGRQVILIFQPHLYSRTRDFAREFAKALDAFDQPWLTEIYPARETPVPGVDSAMLLSLMANPAKALVPKSEILAKLLASAPDVVVTAGAGDIDRLIPDITQTLQSLVP